MRLLVNRTVQIVTGQLGSSHALIHHIALSNADGHVPTAARIAQGSVHGAGPRLDRQRRLVDLRSRHEFWAHEGRLFRGLLTDQ